MTQQAGMNAPFPVQEKPKGLATAALILGIVGCIPCLQVCGIAAIILGVIALSNVKAGTAGGAGMAKAGIILGVVGIVLAVLLTVGWAFMWMMVRPVSRHPMMMHQGY